MAAADSAECRRRQGQRTVHTADGRLLAVEDRGDPAGRPVLVRRGTPSSRLAIRYGLYVRDAADAGYGSSATTGRATGASPQQCRAVADTAADVRTICTELGIDRLATWGHSGGGPHVLACAALFPDLVTAATSLASLAPFDAEGLDYVAGMDQDHVDETRLSSPTRPRPGRSWTRTGRRSRPRRQTRWPGRSSRCSRRQMRLSGSGPARFTSSSCPARRAAWRQAVRDGGRQLHAQAVGIRPRRHRCPVLLLHGRQDMFVPPGHGEWLAKHIPGVEAQLHDDDGHATLVNRIPEVHAWLSEHL